jgi:hypothetical protein
VTFDGEESGDSGTIYVDGERIEQCYTVTGARRQAPDWYVDDSPDRADLFVALDEVEARGHVVPRDVDALRRLVDRHA